MGRGLFINLPKIIVIWLAIEILVFALSLLGGYRIFQTFMFIPSRDIISPPYFFPFTIITYGFLHGGFGHLLWNMTLGLVFSKVVHGVFYAHHLGGRANFLSNLAWGLIFIMGLIGAGIFHAVALGVDSSVGIVGASGGVAAWLGAVVFFIINKIAMPPPFDRREVAIFIVGFLILMNFFGAVAVNYFSSTQISNAGHLGGLLFGFFTTWIWFLSTRPAHRW